MENLLDKETLDRLTLPQPRLPFLESWLLDRVWTMNRFESCDGKPSRYLKSGEAMVNEMECLMTAAADSYFRELCADPVAPRNVANFFQTFDRGCAVVIDGCSIRELPLLRQLAGDAGRPVLETGCSRSSIPSNTERFIGERLGFGLPVIGPSKLGSRKELREMGIQFHYFQDPDEYQSISDEKKHILIWHRFPDRRFMDSTASTLAFYDGIWDTLELVWKRTVQAIPPSRPVLVTSDHGYIYLGSGLSDRTLDGKDRPLKGKRSREFPAGEPLPAETPELFVDRKRNLAVIKGRCHNRPPAPSPSQSIYRHDGISLMEVLTPWLVIGPMEVT
jgi:hypothetical protein